MNLSDYIPLVPTLMLVLVRVLGILVAAPAFGEAVVPWRLRYLLGVAVAMAAVGRMAHPVVIAADWGGLLATVAGEFLIGATMGYSARVVLTGVELGAFHIGQQLGLTLGEIFDPTSGESSDAVRRLFALLAIVLFLGIGGHRTLLACVMGTFQAVPPGAGSTRTILDLVVLLLGSSFVLALKVAAPVLIALLLATLALGVLQNSVPACNVLSIGLPARAMLGLAVMGLGLAGLGTLLESFVAAWARHAAIGAVP